MFWSLHLHFHGQLLIWSARHLGTQSSVGSWENKTPRGTERGFLFSGRSRFPSHIGLYSNIVWNCTNIYTKNIDKKRWGSTRNEEDAVPAPVTYFQEAESFGLVLSGGLRPYKSLLDPCVLISFTVSLWFECVWVVVVVVVVVSFKGDLVYVDWIFKWPSKKDLPTLGWNLFSLMSSSQPAGAMKHTHAAAWRSAPRAGGSSPKWVPPCSLEPCVSKGHCLVTQDEVFLISFGFVLKQRSKSPSVSTREEKHPISPKSVDSKLWACHVAFICTTGLLTAPRDLLRGIMMLTRYRL